MFNSQNQAPYNNSNELFAKADLSDVTFAIPLQVVETFEQVPDIQPGDRVIYINQDGHSVEGRFINSYKRCRRNAYEKKFNKSWRTAAHWQDEESYRMDENFHNKSCEPGDKYVRWVCKRDNGIIDMPLSENVYHPSEVEKPAHEIFYFEA